MIELSIRLRNAVLWIIATALLFRLVESYRELSRTAVEIGSIKTHDQPNPRLSSSSWEPSFLTAFLKVLREMGLTMLIWAPFSLLVMLS